MYYNSLKEVLLVSYLFMISNADYAEEPFATPSDSTVLSSSSEINFIETTVVEATVI